MSYTVLARRYRSGTFDEVVGQEHVAQTLKKAIASGRVAHAYLFCGTRGVGKTSMARILAKALNCEKAKDATTEPCGQCASCQAIARGDDIDVIEIDAASNTGVDNVRDLIANAQYRPARSRYKVYIIDEVHMLSKAAFNALLKTMEEPPEHVKFILATTEVEKVLPTILSRCQRYDFRNIPTREIAAHLKAVAKQEKIKADDEALQLIARAGAGSMRDALSLLDRLLSVGEKHLTVEGVESLLGLPRTQVVFNLAQSIGEGDTRAVLTRADEMIAGGLSADSLVASLVDHLRNLLIIRSCGADSQLVDVPGLSMKDLAAQADRFDPMVLAQDITILEELRRQMRSSAAGRALLDATLVRLALAEQFASVADLLARTNGGPRGGAAPSGAASAQKKNSSPLSTPAPALTPSPRIAPAAPAPAPVAAVAAPAATSAGEDEDDDLPRPGKVWENDGPSLSELLKQQAQRQAAPHADTAPPPGEAADPTPAECETPARSNVEAVDPSNLPAVWKALMDLIAEKGPGLTSLLSHGRYLGVDAEGRAVIQYTKQHQTFVKLFERNGKKDAVREALSQVLRKNVGVVFEVDAQAAVEEAEAPAPAKLAQGVVRREIPAPADAAYAPPPSRPTPEQIAALRETEPLIKALIDQFGAQVLKIEA